MIERIAIVTAVSAWSVVSVVACADDHVRQEPLDHLDLALGLSSASISDISAGVDPVIQAEPDRGRAFTPSSDSDWEFTIAPYLWLMSLRAEAEIDGESVTADACFIDLLHQLDGAAQLRFEGRKNRWGFYLDGTYLSLSVDDSVRTRPFSLHGLDAELKLTEAWVEFGGMYRFGETGRSLDVMLGGRYAHVSTEISIGPFDSEENEDYLALVVGMRGQLALSDRWLVMLAADVGGFGIGDAADLVWSATGLFGYRLTDSATFAFGYRIYHIDIGGSLDQDLLYHGPMMGVAFTF